MDAEKTGGLSVVRSGSDNISGEVITGTTAQYGETVRGLSPRHVQLMAIGGSIGTGLWVRLSSPRFSPFSAFLAFSTFYPGAMTNEN